MEPPELETLPACPLCGHSDRQLALRAVDHLLSKQLFELKDCTSCGFRFTDPRPGPRDIGRYYESTDYISHTNAQGTLSDRLYQFARERAFRSKYRLVRRHQATGHLLDVGCGTGGFLKHMRGRGYTVLGIEPSVRAREQALVQGLEVLPAFDLVPGAGQFNILTLWHVLEHFHDPSETMRALLSSLANGGVLFIAVPDRESWDRQHYGAHWAAWDVPRHLSHFRQRDVEKLVSGQGLRLVGKRRMWLDAPYVSMLSERYRGRGPFSALAIGLLKGGWSNMVSLATGRPTSSMLFVARKG